jgi:precorrin-6B methylase 1
MNKEIKINDEQVDINTFVTWFNECLDTLGIDDEKITQEQAEEIAEKFFNNLNEETTS